MNRKQKLLFTAVKNAIDKWNPYGLLPDAPIGEFDRESKAIAAKIGFESDVNDIARVISRILSSSFEQNFFQVKDCIAVAIEVKQNIDSLCRL